MFTIRVTVSGNANTTCARNSQDAVSSGCDESATRVEYRVSNGSESSPEKVDIVIVPSAYDDFLMKTGDIRVTFSDGPSELLTKEGNCALPRISPRGEIGWLRVDKTNIDVQQKNRRGVDAVVVRLPDGTTKEFVAGPQAPFIGSWKFGDRGKSIVIQSSSYHGPRFYVRYDLETGKVKDKINTYEPYEQLPLWAKPLAREDG
jgi:hypothetical protein